ncbi:MAG: hypothetical protein ACKVQK_03575 [Burkholderiales bacterium]
MANLGNCMLFYLKYAAEMERLYEAEKPKDEGLPEPNRILEKIKLVGDTASREVAEFLEFCALGIEAHFHAISDVKRVRNNLEKTWGLDFWVGPKDATDRRIEIGVNIIPNLVAVIPWIWCRGGRRAEDEMVRIMGGRIKHCKLPGWESGTVVLDEIKIPLPARLEDSIERESLIAQVQHAFAAFTEQDIAAIDGIASNRGEA